MEPFGVVSYDAAPGASRSLDTGSRDGLHSAEVIMNSAYELGQAALTQAADVLTRRHDGHESEPCNLEGVISLVKEASDSQPGSARRASRLEVDQAAVIKGLAKFQNLTSTLDRYDAKYSSLMWSVLRIVIVEGKIHTDFMRSLYHNLTQISLLLASLSFDSNFPIREQVHLVADLYAAFMDFLVLSMQWLVRSKWSRLRYSFTNRSYIEQQAESVKKIEAITSRIRDEQLGVLQSNILALLAITSTRDLHTTPFSVIESVRARSLPGQVDRIDSTSAMMLGSEFDARAPHGLAWINQTEQDRQSILHLASRQGYHKVVRWALDKGADAKKLDMEERTPLFGAVEGCHTTVVELLVTTGADKGMDVNQVSKNGKSALDIAVAIDDTKGLHIVRLLLKNKASPTKGIDSAALNLLSSAAQGSLRPNANISQLTVKDRLGYTVLHEAVSFGHRDLVNSLLKLGVDIDLRATVGGDSILHVLIERGYGYRQFYDSNSGRDLESLPTLDHSHSQIAKLLLEYGVVATGSRWADRLTPQELVEEKLERLGHTPNDDRERTALRAILDLLKDPPPIRSFKAPQEVTSIPITDLIKKKACAQFDVSVVRDLRVKTFRLGNLIYDDSPEGASKNQWPADRNRANEVAIVKTDWTWVHLPANNKTWVKDFLQTFKAKENFMNDLKWPNSLSWSKANGFIDNSFHEVQGLATHARFRRPKFMSLSGSSHPPISSLVIPYFDVETTESHCPVEVGRGLLNHQLRKWKNLKDAYGDLHTPCSLDQSYYRFLRDSTSRDKTQVVGKYAERADPTVQSTKLLMVNQIWLWRIDPGILITCFPNRRHDNGKKELLDFILKGMLRDKPQSMDRMILQILIHATGFVDDPEINAGLDENLFDIFEQSIAHEADVVTNCYENLYYLHREEKILLSISDEATREILDKKMCNIVEEVKHLREIKDILDELRMIDRVLTDQQTVVQEYEKGAKSLQDDDKVILEDLMDSLNFRILKVKRLAKDATAIETSLNDLLDLKQKQANLLEARDTRQLAKDAKKRALAGEKQGKQIFLFTLVTVIFTPLSFASSFLAVPSKGFPQNSTGSGIGWTLWQVVTAIVVTEVIGVLIPMALMWFWMFERQSNDPNNFVDEIRNRLNESIRQGPDRRTEEAAGVIQHHDNPGTSQREDAAANC